MSDKTKGLYSKYIAFRRDGSSGIGEKHHGCPLFVLDLKHDRHAIPAMEAYINACREEYPQLAADLESLLMDLLIAETPGKATDCCACCGETKRNDTNTWFICTCRWVPLDDHAAGTKCSLHRK
jgi:hypothetical protein